MPGTDLAKEEQAGKQQCGMFGSGKNDYKTMTVKRRKKQTDWGVEIRVEENGKTMYCGTAEVAGVWLVL